MSESSITYTTETFQNVMTKLPVELQYLVMSYTYWGEYPIKSLLENISTGCALLKFTMIEKLFNLVELDHNEVTLGSFGPISIYSYEFKLLLKILKNLGKNGTKKYQKFVIKNLKIGLFKEPENYRVILLLKYSKRLEIDHFESVAMLKLTKINYLRKVRICTIKAVENADADDLVLILSRTLRHLEINAGPLESNKLSSVELKLHRLKLFVVEQKKKKLQVDLKIVINSIDKLDFESLPKLRIPNSNVTLDIKSTKGLEAGQLRKFIIRSFGLREIKSLTINFEKKITNNDLKDASFVEDLTQLKILKLYGDFELGSSTRSPVLNLDELVLSRGYANLDNVLARKMTLKNCVQRRNTIINEGVEELTVTSCLDWDIVKLPQTLIDLHINNWLFGKSFAKIELFETLANLKRLKIIYYIENEYSNPPYELRYYVFKLYGNYLDGEVDFDFLDLERSVDLYRPELKQLGMMKVLRNLDKVRIYNNPKTNEFVWTSPQYGLDMFYLKKMTIESKEKYPRALTVEFLDEKTLQGVDFREDLPIPFQLLYLK
ncbi:hypothetical protein CANARDRAFT_5014 [[Candida] arabinofermentans NRRL YB-2248]|uniref:F-box domain-containing protein n=1 Tax=[Candida] arabinofermentans NRRL YB-2248 TaxID=983967 RepID=A0A1E4T7G6_9ASCO|nr:hypothetical protein CANARDRAFT_5014 [[Candida] arabinofermentans NRRL YB-2248]